MKFHNITKQIAILVALAILMSCFLPESPIQLVNYAKSAYAEGEVVEPPLNAESTEPTAVPAATPDPVEASEFTDSPSTEGTPMAEATVEPIDSPKPSSESTPEQTSLPEAIDYTKDASFSDSFLFGYAGLLHDADLYQDPSSKESAASQIERGVVYAISRPNPGDLVDRIRIAYACSEGVSEAYVDAQNVKPMTDNEILTYVTENRNICEDFYEDDRGIPLAVLVVTALVSSAEDPGAAPVFCVSPASAAFSLREASQHHADLTFSLTAENTTFSGIEGMVADVDYKVDASQVTIYQASLATLAVGSHTLNFTFASGNSVSVVISVYDVFNENAVSPSGASFDAAVPADVELTLDLSGCAFAGVSRLAEGTDYTLQDGKLTIKAAYLETLTPGSHELSIKLDCGDDIPLPIDVSDSAPVAELTPANATFDKWKPADLAVQISQGAPALSGIAGLTEGVDFTVSENTVTLTQQSLALMAIGEHTLYLAFAGPRYVPITLTVLDTTPMLTVDGVLVSVGSGDGWTYASGILTISKNGLTVGGASEQASVQVVATVTQITLDGLRLGGGSVSFLGVQPSQLEITLSGDSAIVGSLFSTNGNLVLSGTGSLEITATSAYPLWAQAIVINGGTITATESGTPADGTRASGISGAVTINGGTVTASADAGPDKEGFGIYSSSGITINGGTVSSSGNGKSGFGIYAKSEIVIKGGSVSAQGCGSSLGGGLYAGWGILTITGENTDVNGNGVASNGTAYGAYSYSKANIEGGKNVLSAAGNISYGIYSKSTLTISGGKLDANANAGTNGQSAYGANSGFDMTITGGSVVLLGTGSTAYGAYANNMFTISGGTLSAKGMSADWKGYGIYGYSRVCFTGGQTTTYGAGSNSGYGVTGYLNVHNHVEFSGASTYVDMLGSTQALSTFIALNNSVSVGAPDEVRVLYQNGDFKKGVIPDSLVIGGTTYSDSDLLKNPSGDGWAWDYLNNTLTLNGYQGSQILCSGSDVTLNVLLASGTENAITCTSGIAMQADNLVLSGEGSLTVDSSASLSDYTYGIYANSVEILSGSVNASAHGQNDGWTYGIYARDGVRIAGGCVTAQAGESDSAYAIYGLLDETVITGGSVTAIVLSADFCAGISGYSVSISGGTITTNGCGIRSSIDDITISGGDLSIDLTGADCDGLSAVDDLEIAGATIVIKGTAGTKGIYAHDDMLIHGGTVTVNGCYSGVSATGDVTVLDGAITADDVQYGIYAFGKISVSGGTTYIYAEKHGIWGGSIEFSGDAYAASIGDLFALYPLTVSVNGTSVYCPTVYAIYEDGVLRTVNVPLEISIGGGTYPASQFARGMDTETWSWDPALLALVLHGYHGSRIGCSGGLKLILADGTENEITETDSYRSAIGASSITISGTGTLSTLSTHDGLYASPRNVMIESGTIVIRTTDAYSDGIYANTGIEIGSGARVVIYDVRSAVNPFTITLGGHSVQVNASEIEFLNGVIASVRTPNPLKIGEETYSILDLISQDRSGTGWLWNHETNVLTLDGYHGGEISSPKYLSITMADGSQNNATSISAPTGIEIDGDGILVADEMPWSSSLTVRDGIILTNSSSVYNLKPSGGMVFYGSGNSYTLAGSFDKTCTIKTDKTLPAGNMYTIPWGFTLEVVSGATLIVNGSLINNGTITGTVVDGDGNTTKLRSVTLGSGNRPIYPGESFTLVASASPDYAASKTLNWTSDSVDVATVDASGRVTGVSAGMVHIRATAADGGGAYAECSVRVLQFVTSISLGSDRITLLQGKFAQIAAVAQPGDAYDKRITWTSSDLTVVRVDATGGITGIQTGMATVTATAADGRGAKASCTVIVLPLVSSLTLNLPAITIAMGQVVSTVTATVLPDEAGDRTLNWTSANPSVARVDAYGRITGVKTGKAVITAAAQDGSGKQASVTVTVVSAKKGVTGIKLSAKSATVYERKTLTLKATLSPSSPTDKTIRWLSSDPAVAAVSSKGVVTGLKVGSATITVICSSGYAATCAIRVTEVPVSSVKFSSTKATISIGATYQIKATVSPSDAKDKALAWSSSNSNIATVSGSGKILGVGAGTATITAISANGIRNKFTVKVTPVLVKSVAMKPTKATIVIGKGEALGKTLMLSASVSPSNATNKQLIWSSSNTKVAKVDQNGVVTSVGDGKATITAKAKDGSGKKVTCVITVSSAKASAPTYYTIRIIGVDNMTLTANGWT